MSPAAAVERPADDPGQVWLDTPCSLGGGRHPCTCDKLYHHACQKCEGCGGGRPRAGDDAAARILAQLLSGSAVNVVGFCLAPAGYEGLGVIVGFLLGYYAPLLFSIARGKWKLRPKGPVRAAAVRPWTR